MIETIAKLKTNSKTFLSHNVNNLKIFVVDNVPERFLSITNSWMEQTNKEITCVLFLVVLNF